MDIWKFANKRTYTNLFVMTLQKVVMLYCYEVFAVPVCYPHTSLTLKSWLEKKRDVYNIIIAMCNCAYIQYVIDNPKDDDVDTLT